MQWEHPSFAWAEKSESHPSWGRSRHFNLHINGAFTLEFKDAAITINAQNYCGTLQDLHTAIKKKCSSTLIICVTMWLAPSSTTCTRCWTISHTAWICHHVTSMHLALSKKQQRAAHSLQTKMSKRQWWSASRSNSGNFGGRDPLPDARLGCLSWCPCTNFQGSLFLHQEQSVNWFHPKKLHTFTMVTT